MKHLSALEAAHNIAKGLFKAGVIDNMTMKEFDEVCSSNTSTFLSPEEVLKIRIDREYYCLMERINKYLTTSFNGRDSMIFPLGEPYLNETIEKVILELVEKGWEVEKKANAPNYNIISSCLIISRFKS